MSTPSPQSPWPEDLVRLFLSHSAIHKEFAGEVAEALRDVGVYGFVAHDTMAVTLPWQEQIEGALATAEALVALVHPEVNSSAWCQQEIGWAYGRAIPVLCIRMGADPPGFPGRTQWPSCNHQTARDVARTITAWLNSLSVLSDRIAGGLLRSLEEAGNYYAAQAAAQALDTIGTLTPEQWETLDRIFLANNQVGGSVLATRALRPLYDRAGRSFPTKNA